MTGIKLGKAGSFRGNPVDVGCPNEFLPVTAQLPIAPIIGHDENDMVAIRDSHFAYFNITLFLA